MYNYYPPYAPPQLSQEQFSKLQKNFYKDNYRRAFSSAGFNTVIAFLTFQVAAVILSVIYNVFGLNAVTPYYFDAVPNTVLNGLVSLIGMGGMSLILISTSKMKPKDTFIFNKVGFRKTTLLVMAGFAVCMLSNVLTSEFLSSMENIGINLNPSYDSPALDSPLEAAVSLISVALVPAISEEMFFRGLILSKLKPFGDGFAIFASSLLFALMHGNFVQIPFTLFVGLTLGYVTVYSGSMLPAMLIHFSNNAYSVLADVLYTNYHSFNLNELAVNIIVMGFLIVSITLGIISAVILSSKDKNLFRMNKPKGYFDLKTRNKLFITSPGILAAIVLFLGEAVLTLFL